MIPSLDIIVESKRFQSCNDEIMKAIDITQNSMFIRFFVRVHPVFDVWSWRKYEPPFYSKQRKVVINVLDLLNTHSLQLFSLFVKKS